ncbi:GTPase activating protein and VPS9 domains 1 isoform X2 [Oratosquilla oratoria]|uniref:GTPase activating protein and VPS9 domains 1 isoform X2 n=1 Tax=Oratosquilla oratoria TaxID=337810 RepID=UPI003F76E14E
MAGVAADMLDLALSLKQEKLYVDAEKHQIQILNEKVLKTIERVHHLSWIRGEQRRNYDDLVLRPHTHPPLCCRRANLLHQLTFVDAHKVLGFQEALYGDLLAKLREKPQLLAQCLVLGEQRNLQQMHTAAATVFSSLYGACILPSDETHVLFLLKHLIQLQLAPSETPRRLLRHGSCAFSQVFRAYLDSLPLAKVFLTAALHQPMMQLLMEDELFLDIDPSKAAVRFSPEERRRRFGEEGTPEYTQALAKYRAWTIAKLVHLTNRFISRIQEALYVFPPTLAWLVRVLYEVLLTSAAADAREVGAICVDVVFAFFLCPAIVSPEPHGICDAPISHISRFNLMQVAQILQVLAMSRWEQPDPRHLDLYKHFDKQVMGGLVDRIMEQAGSDVPPQVWSGGLESLNRACVLVPEPHLHNLITLLSQVQEELSDGDENQKFLESILGRLKPKGSRLSTFTSSTSSIGTPSHPKSQGGLSRIDGSSIKRSLLGRVKSTRNRSTKSQSENWSDADSLMSSSNQLHENNRSTGSGEEGGDGGSGGGNVEDVQLAYDTVLVISLPSSSPPQCPGLLAEDKMLAALQASKATSRVRMNVEEEPGGAGSGGTGEGTIEKRTRFSLSHDEGSIGNTSDNLEAISEAASNHSVASSLDDVEQEDQPDNLSDMVSANVSGRGTPNVSGRDTPSSQVTEGEDVGLRGGPESHQAPHNIPVTVPKSARADIEEKFGRFEIKPLIGGHDETVSMVSDTWSTDVLASDSETIEAADRGGSGVSGGGSGCGGDQFHEQLLNRHLEELDRMQGDLLGSEVETFETASEAWSTDVLASDSERMTEFDTDDAGSVTRSDDTGRSEVEQELGAGDLRHDLQQQEDSQASRSHECVSFGSGDVIDSSGVGGGGGGGCSSGGGILKPTPVHLGMSSSMSKTSQDRTKAWKCDTTRPPVIEFEPISDDRMYSGKDNQEEEVEGEGDVQLRNHDEKQQEIASATQTLGRLSLNLSSLPNNGLVATDQHLLLNKFITRDSNSQTLAGSSSSFSEHAGTEGASTMEEGEGTEVKNRKGSRSSDTLVTMSPQQKLLLSSDRGSGEDSSSLHLSTTSLASSSSSSSSGSDVATSISKLREAGGGSISGGESAVQQLTETQAVRSSAADCEASSVDDSGGGGMAATGAIPKSISFDKTAERGDRDSMDNNDAKNKRGFFKNFKLPGFKARRKTIGSVVGGSSGSSQNEDGSHHLDRSLAAHDVGALRRAHSEDSRPATIQETSDDILAKYRNKKTQHSDTANPSTPDSTLEDTKGDEEQGLDMSFAFNDAKRKLRIVLSTADLCLGPALPSYGPPLHNNKADGDVVTWLRAQLAEGINLHDRALVAQLHETLRCVQLFDSQGRERLVHSLRDDYRRRSPYIAYLVRSRQGLLTTIAHLEKLLSRLDVDCSVIMASLVNVCVRLFLERREQQLARFTFEFTQVTVPDEKVQLVEKFLTQLYAELERDPMWISSTQEQLQGAQLALERAVMSHIYIHALYPNGDGDVSRDQVLHEHMSKLAAVITPDHKDLRIPKLYQYECPWPSAQAEVVRLGAYKTPGDKLQCVIRAAQTLMNLLSLAHHRSVPAADDFMPVFVYMLIKANPPALLSTVQYVNLFYEQRLEGEDQYWWTQFCSAIEFIKTMDY